jgi:hypothetical protein
MLHFHYEFMFGWGVAIFIGLDKSIQYPGKFLLNSCKSFGILTRQWNE